jgi:hypothetical protein
MFQLQLIVKLAVSVTNIPVGPVSFSVAKSNNSLHSKLHGVQGHKKIKFA